MTNKVYSLALVCLLISLSNATKCTVNKSGSYHSDYWTNGTVTQSDVEITHVNYFYQMEYDSTIVKDDAAFEEMQNTLEKHISNEVLSSTKLFENCYMGTPSSSTRSLGSDPNVNILPVSLFYGPKDEVTDIQCTTEDKIEAFSTCIVLEGTLTLFYIEENASTTSLVTYKNEVKHVIDNGMNKNNGFKSAHDAIINLKYMDWEAYKELKRASSKLSSTSGSSSLGFGTILGGAAATFAILLLAGLTVKYYKRSSSSEPSGLQGNGSSVV